MNTDIERLSMIKKIIRVTDDLAEVEASLESPGKSGEVSDRS
ncbi:MAG: hypothetical protein Q3M30_05710 [Candidatus Electrothrix sp. Rat3]|nr:hypothetical protein [Candidatus Electrothrix rattekaaiensis]